MIALAKQPRHLAPIFKALSLVLLALLAVVSCVEYGPRIGYMEYSGSTLRVSTDKAMAGGERIEALYLMEAPVTWQPGHVYLEQWLAYQKANPSLAFIASTSPSAKPDQFVQDTQFTDLHLRFDKSMKYIVFGVSKSDYPDEVVIYDAKELVMPK